MYEYRKLTTEQRQALIEQRIARGFPTHSPPHIQQDDTLYLLSATCYNHAIIMQSPNRREELLNAIFKRFIQNGYEIHAWVVLPNHYHVLAHVMEFDLLSSIFRQILGFTSYDWNKDDACQGRKVWFRYTDRLIRSERHYYTTLNYIHYNPVKHGWSNSAYEWKASSLHWYLEQNGREWLRNLWSKYPVRNYGRGWDDFESAKAPTTSNA